MIPVMVSDGKRSARAFIKPDTLEILGPVSLRVLAKADIEVHTKSEYPREWVRGNLVLTEVVE